jgi:hypothetical protein
MKNAKLVIFTLFITFISCKKSSSDPQPAPAAEKYMDFTAGTSSKYQTTNNLTAAVTLNTLTSTNRDSVISGKTYHVFTNSNGTPNEYYNITGSDYWTFRSLGVAFNNQSVASIYLKDNAAVNTSWNTDISLPVTGFPGGVPVTLINTINQAGISRTVNGVNYTDVLHIVTTVSVTGLPAGSITTDIHSYYARKAGLIENVNKISAALLGINVDQKTILVQ